ncbi:hypothetical protein A1Q2_06234 [Trichosporon asahii var. asahii CBS 8904]|uniref:AB hydrolase-1 domain-containing protein n=1 Tax=Trichosporon asahii var. asahii (strain CBS 8904) TaxID=1220162 RepID=K1VS52_TRIAC|nr:hypothetical protein A1Q2_06234 [Trichosporon asahii var. asahii CBS 8904]
MNDVPPPPRPPKNMRLRNLVPFIAGASAATSAPVDKLGDSTLAEPTPPFDPPTAPLSPAPKLSPSNPPGYQDQKAWKVIQSHLPLSYQLNASTLPSEEWWDWSGHKIHLDRYPNPSAPVKVILFHGVGTNGRQMSTILGHPLSAHAETVATDMPLYGVTRVAPGHIVSYDDWVAAGAAFVDYELARDTRPIVLYGLSAGGMLAYHVAAANPKVKGIVGMTFLDQRIREVRDGTALLPAVAQLGYPIAGAASSAGLAGLRIPMAAVSKMWALVNDKPTLKDFFRDTTSAGNSVPLKFLASYARYAPKIEPEDFTVCPILLTQPEKDRWTPLEYSELFLDKIDKVRVEKKTLPEAGHYPIEEEGLRALNRYVQEFVLQVAKEAGTIA